MASGVAITSTAAASASLTQTSARNLCPAASDAALLVRAVHQAKQRVPEGRRQARKKATARVQCLAPGRESLRGGT